MRIAITRIVGGLVLLVSVVVIVFVTGMRAKSPAVVNGVRRLAPSDETSDNQVRWRPGTSTSDPPRRTDIRQFLLDAGGGGADRGRVCHRAPVRAQR